MQTPDSQDDSTKKPDTKKPGDDRVLNQEPPPPPRWAIAPVAGRVLDPATAFEVDGVPARPTVYVGPRLTISSNRDNFDDILGKLETIAAKLGWKITAEEEVANLPESDDEAKQRTGPPEPTLGVRRLHLSVADSKAATAPDGWTLLQQARAKFGLDILQGVGLDHVLMPSTEASPFHAGPFHAGPFHAGPFHAGPFHAGPFHAGPSNSNPRDEAGSSMGVASYGWPGSGGRQPVAYVGPPPHRLDEKELTRRRPVVAIIDTGCAKHAWLDRVVDTTVTLKGATIGYTDPATSPDDNGNVSGPLDGSIDSLAGHGTFIAGLVHQACPDADILAWRAVPSEGPIVESDLVKVLSQVLDLVKLHRADPKDPDGRAIDVLNLSLGYYHETPKDLLYDSTMRDILHEFGKLGVIVVCAAGNEATSRPHFPAAFAPWEDNDGPCAPDSNVVPVVSVGALNPNWRTDALFSNAGPWVRSYVPGAAVVSTMPAFQGGLQSMVRTEAYGRTRESIDPDDYRGGFAVWSGTSFAAPLMAGAMAGALMKELEKPDEAVEPATVVRRAWDVVERCTPIRS